MNKEALTAEEVAEMLQIGRNAVYDLAKTGELGSYRIGRKLRFTYADVQAYILASRQPSRQGAPSVTPPSAQQAEDCEQFIICGQNLMLDVLVNYMARAGASVARAYANSYDSLTMLYKRQVQVAALHLWDGDTDQFNAPYLRRFMPGVAVVTVRLLSRMTGLVVASGNPKQLHAWADLAKPGVMLMNQEPGTSPRILLDEHLRVEGIDPRQVGGYGNEGRSRVAIATAIANGKADVAIGTEKIVRQVEGVEFVPLQKEHIDLALRREDFDTPQAQAMMDVLESDELRDDFGCVNGYDVSDMGRIISF